MKNLFLFLLIILPFLAVSQNKKVLDHAAYDEWHKINKQLISNDGNYVAYSTKPNGYGNDVVHLHKIEGKSLLTYERGSNPVFTNNSSHLIFKASPDFAALRDLKRKKTKEKDLPGDTLVIYSMANGDMKMLAGLKSFKVPEKWDNYLVYLHAPAIDSTNLKEKKRNKKNGYDLVIRNLTSQSEFTFPYVVHYAIAEEGPALALTTTGNDSTLLPGVYAFDFSKQSYDPVFRSNGEYRQLVWDKKGEQLSFISDTDST